MSERSKINAVGITPEPTQFVANSATLKLVNSISTMAPWRASLEQAVQTGSLYSSGIPLSDESVVNNFGQVYFGPVTLITDAYCYSACDMFAAGFQDHEIGPVLGVDEATGAGGANVLTHADLNSEWTDGPLKTLPEGAGMRVSLRRTLRVGARAGQPVEDLGVKRDESHLMTKNDLLNGNSDLMAKAGKLLKRGTPRQFDVDLSLNNQTLSVAITSQNVTSADIYINDRPVVSGASLTGGSSTVDIPAPSGNTNLRIDGFDRRKLVASYKRNF